MGRTIGLMWLLPAFACFVAAIPSSGPEQPLWMIAGAVFVIAGRLGEDKP